MVDEPVRRSLSPEARERFEARVTAQAAFLREELERGALDNEAFAVGMELEVYGVDSGGRLSRLPEAVFESDACETELGLHNAELNTEPDVFDAAGLRSQATRLSDGVAAARSAFERAERELVLDAMWTIPPEEGTRAYLADHERDGVVVRAANMRDVPRYRALDSAVVERVGTIELDVPGAVVEFPSILFESLATSIQPHLQVPDAEAFPAHYNAAVRTLGPVLALATNSPFLPADLYDDVMDPHALVADTHHELRIAAFEQSMNAGVDGADRKVRFPEDIDEAGDVVEHIAADDALAPFLREWVDGGDAPVESYPDRFWEFDHKRSTFWRWSRAVVGGTPAGGDERSLRIEYRPLPTQPSVADTVGFQALVAGLVRGLAATDHPLDALPWTAARDCFYDVVERGFEADLAWVTADGERVGDPDAVYEDLFAVARRGLREQGLPDDEAAAYLAPVERRWRERAVPSGWKKRAVRERLADGATLPAAIEGMQREYIVRQRADEPFVEWA